MMRAFFAEEQKRHEPERFMVAGEFRDSAEQSERADRLKAGAEAAGLTLERPSPGGLAEIAAVHTPEYLTFLSTIHDRWRSILGAGPEVLPNLHLDRRLGGYPTSPIGLAAYHQADCACPIGPHTWEAAQWSAWAAVAGAEAVRTGDRAAYALCRPPGHHAYADLAGGFCFLNNAAIAAETLRKSHQRVAILDIDVHHGNGTQGIFYGRRDVLTVSIHADPHVYYPFLCGYAHERGDGQGTGYNANLPLPQGTGDEDYFDALDLALDRLTAFAPGALIIALGLDAHEDDPLKGMTVTTAGFEQVGARLGAVDLPTLLVQEGGYLSPALGGNLTAFLSGYRQAANV